MGDMFSVERPEKAFVLQVCTIVVGLYRRLACRIELNFSTNPNISGPSSEALDVDVACGLLC